MNLVEGFVRTWEPFSEHARKAQGIVNMKRFFDLFNKPLMTDQAEFDDFLASKTDSPPGLDGIPYGVYKCAGVLGSKFLFRAHKAVLEGSTIPDCSSECGTFLPPKLLILMIVEGLFDHLMHVVR